MLDDSTTLEEVTYDEYHMPIHMPKIICKEPNCDGELILRGHAIGQNFILKDFKCSNCGIEINGGTYVK